MQGKVISYSTSTLDQILRVLNQKSVFSFDIDDVITESKQPITKEMAQALVSLMQRGITVHLITGGKYEHIHETVVKYLQPFTKGLEKLYISPTSGGALVRYVGHKPETIYEHRISKDEFLRIKNKLLEALELAGYTPQRTYGEIVEYRITGVTMSILGQEAPLEEKVKFDPDRSKRREIISYLTDLQAEYNVRIGGTTSIDVTIKGINKGYGVKRLVEHLGINSVDLIFLGDSLFKEGNDYPVVEAGFDAIAVKRWQDTYEILTKFLSAAME